MSLRIGQKNFFHDTYRTCVRDTLTNNEQGACEDYVDKIYHDFLAQTHLHANQGPVLHRNSHVSYLLKALRHLPRALEVYTSIKNFNMHFLLSIYSLDASRPWLVYWIVQSLYLLNEKLSDDYIDDICEFLKCCQHSDGGFEGGPGQIAHLHNNNNNNNIGEKEVVETRRQ